MATAFLGKMEKSHALISPNCNYYSLEELGTGEWGSFPIPTRQSFGNRDWRVVETRHGASLQE
ncbi:hypothetical protein WA1_04510 [Scytonema hofmannii PCC 7110]|uniref:Uncharacterized protein n=1 Tax=Scytonema hofmannii PCC 7110 TaxID=128403 RepID=A0A139WZG7_9CYAN|nr:hypothetical protein WA1_04510 [Scytonema hofmannii PCC 7110]